MNDQVDGLAFECAFRVGVTSPFCGATLDQV